MRKSTVLIAFAAAAAMLCAVEAANAKYPIDASWFANRWTLDDWTNSLKQFQEQGGSIVWQRGANFRYRVGGATELMNDPDYIWCWALGNCLNEVVSDIESRGLKVGRWFTYANEEQYEDDIMLKCEMDKKINSSRVYHRMVVPQTYDPNWDCTFKEGETVDIIFTIFTGIDPHTLLVEAAENLGMEVYLPMPAIPDPVDQRGAFYEFTKRVLKHYSYAYDGKQSYKGVYQTNEAWLGVSDLSQVVASNEILSEMIHNLGKLYVISPYIDVNLNQIHSTSVSAHVEGFKKLARSGCDIIAVQEGRGCAKGAYWWNFQSNVSVDSVDPVLDDITRYLDPTLKAHATFSDAFATSNFELFKGFETAVDELATEGVTTVLWLNLEAFEYLRDYPCLPVDPVGNGMAELLDRTTKSRLDWGLTVAGSRSTKMISFAWDGDFLCTDGGYEKSLTEEIKDDWDRPIVSYFDRKTGDVRGFNIAGSDTQILVKCSSGYSENSTVLKTDGNFGSKNNRAPLLQQAFFSVPSRCLNDLWICIKARTPSNGKESYYEHCNELNVNP